MLASGIAAGIAAGLAFGGDWRRLANLQLRWWPLLVVAASLRFATALIPTLALVVYVLGFLGIGIVAARNWRQAGAALIALGTLSNLVVVLANLGMPYDVATAASVAAPIPNDSLHIPISSATHLGFLSDVIPLGFVRSVYSIGDFLIAFGGFLMPFVLLQPEADASRHELRSANFAFFWMAQVVSRFGDPITLVALAFVTYRVTESAFLTALAVSVATIPNALFGFFGGAIADAVGPRRAMLWCDVGRTFLIGAIPPLLLLRVPLVFVLLLAFAAGIGGAIVGPARGALVPSLVTRERLTAANSLVYASDRAVEIGGALAGGALVVVLGENAFYVDALTFALSAVLVARVAVLERVRPVTFQRVLSDASEGLRFLRRSSVLWANTIFSIIAQSANPVVNTLTPAFLIRRFANNDPVAGAVLYAGSEAAIALGAVLASAVLPRYLSRLHKGRTLIGGFLSFGLVIVLIAIAPSYTSALILFVALGITNVLFFVPNITIAQEVTPQAIVARVFGARIALTNLSWLPIIFLGGLIGDAIGVDRFLAIAGGVTLVTAIAGAFIPAVRDVP
ncbi:MAG TPA: MFS transporter [Candidatus Limnocylindria bacterium]